MLVAVSVAISLLRSVLAETHYVIVGGPDTLRFKPPYVHAKAGDTVRYWFQQTNHTVTQSSFDHPCTPWEGGFDSGFKPVEEFQLSSFPYWDLKIEDTNPIWAYCRQGVHCSKGMVFAVNPPEDKFEEFQQKAISTSTGASPDPAPTIGKWEGEEHHVTVGGEAGNVYTPPYVNAKPGDKVIFTFKQKNHTVTQSSFDNPCQMLEHPLKPGEAPFDSGFMPVPPETTTGFPTWELKVNETTPVWAYCQQGTHCRDGMVFAINPETEHTSFKVFKDNAAASSQAAPPPVLPHPSPASYSWSGAMSQGDAHLLIHLSGSFIQL